MYALVFCLSLCPSSSFAFSLFPPSNLYSSLSPSSLAFVLSCPIPVELFSETAITEVPGPVTAVLPPAEFAQPRLKTPASSSSFLFTTSSTSLKSVLASSSSSSSSLLPYSSLLCPPTLKGMFTAAARSRLSPSLTRQRLSPASSLLKSAVSL